MSAPASAPVAPAFHSADAAETLTVEPFAFGTEPARPLAATPALERMSERAARLLRLKIEPISRIKLRVAAEPVEICRFDSWKAAQPEFTSVGIYRLRPMKGSMLIAIDPRMIGQLVDAFYGGPGVYGERVVREFTPTEERLLARLSEALVQTLTEVWSEFMPVTAQLTSRETNTSYVALVGHDEPVAVTRFTINFGQGSRSTLDIVYPVASLRAVEGQLSVGSSDREGVHASDWSERLAAALDGVRLEARSVLARPSLSVSELLRLSVGDVIPISMPAVVPLLVEGRQIAVGKLGEQDGHAAIRIERMEFRSSVE